MQDDRVQLAIQRIGRCHPSTRGPSRLTSQTNTIFDDAMTWGNQLGGEIPIPKTQNETIALSKTLTKAIKGKYACEHFWIPIMHGPKPERKDVNGATNHFYRKSRYYNFFEC